MQNIYYFDNVRNILWCVLRKLQDGRRLCYQSATNLGDHGDMLLSRGLEKYMRVMYKNMAEMAKVFIEGFRTIPATIESCLDKRAKG